MKIKLLSHLTLRKRLPLLVCGLLLSVILSFGVLCYLGVRNAALKTGQERLQTLSFHLGEMLSTQASTLLQTVHERANKAAVKKYLRSEGRDSADAIRRWFRELENDSSTARVELLDAGHKTLMLSNKSMAVNVGIDSLLSKQKKAAFIGKLYAVDQGIVYPIVAEIRDSGRLIGYFLRWRILRSAPGSMERLTKLMGSDVTIYIGNADSSLWTDLIKQVSAPLAKRQKTNTIIEYDRSHSRLLASIHPVVNSPWVVSVEIPKTQALRTAAVFLYWLIIGGGILIVLGSFCGWLMSRNLSGPLVKLTRAASEIAAGDFSSQVFVDRHDEVGKLARAFNAMSVQIQNSQQQLEEKAENYRMLFEKNPMPMWIMTKDSHDMLDVNEAALIHYGYSKEEFLHLNAKDIRPVEDVAKFLLMVNKGLNGNIKHGIWRHQKKDGTVFMADVVADDIVYKGQQARLTLVNDVTEKLKAEAELVRHRIMQQEIITETTILVQEKEREEIGKELHDNINQILTSTKLYLEMARNGNIVPLAISKSYENVNLAIQEIRQLSKQLVRPGLDTSLYDSLKDLTEEIKAITPIQIVFIASHFSESALSENLKLMTYRIVQEQLNNILKHAAANEVSVALKTDDEILSLIIEDNGIGFDTEKKGKGIGLRNIESRAQFHRGSLRIISSPGNGCRLEIIVPLLPEAVLLDNE